jgi:hypothetical protein
MSSLRDTERIWAAVGPAALLEVLVPLRDEHLRHGAAMLMPGDVRTLEQIASQFRGRPASVLIVEDPAQPSARSRFSSPFLSIAHEQEFLLGWIRLERPELAAYAHRAVALLRRPIEPELPILLLGPREPRYRQLLDAMEQVASTSSAAAAFRWSADRITRRALDTALRHGAGALLYTGHGNANGWFAYGGLSSSALTGDSPWAHDETIAIAFSLSCRTGAASPPADAADRRLYRGLSDQMVACGAAGVVFAPVGDSLHADTRVLARLLSQALAQGQRSCRDVLDAARSGGSSLAGYVVVGDPGLRAAAAPGATARCLTVTSSSEKFSEQMFATMMHCCSDTCALGDIG